MLKRHDAAGLRWRAAAAAGLVAAILIGGAAHAQQRLAPLERSEALMALRGEVKAGAVDAALPNAIDALKRALAANDMIGFLDLVDPAYFAEQFGFLHGGARPVGETMAQFTCEFLQICSVDEQYAFEDVVSAHLVAADQSPGSSLLSITLEIGLRDGRSLVRTILYSPESGRFLAGLG